MAAILPDDSAKPRTHDLETYLGLKNATRELTRSAGGQKVAAFASRVSQQAISDYGNINALSVFMPLDVIADLEKSVGEPIVTKALAELAGCLLIQLPKEDGGDTLSREAGESAQRFGQMMTDFGCALRDGSINSRDAGALKNDIDQLLVALFRMRQTVIEQGALSP